MAVRLFLATALLAAPAACLRASFGAQVAHPRLALSYARVSVLGLNTYQDQPQRPPYVLTGLSRPLWRGRLMGWLHDTRAWYMLCVLYIIAAWKLPTKLPLTPRELLLRFLAVAASSANVLISNGYHNPDMRGPDALTPEAETLWLRLDYIGISSVLTTLLWLWAANLGFPARMRACSWASGVSTAMVALLARLWVPQKAGHTAVKLIMAFQFAGLLLYFAAFVPFGACAINRAVFWIYAPGLILYVLKRPKSQLFGFHEYFHTSVIMGHTASMILDLKDIVIPCARGFCGL